MPRAALLLALALPLAACGEGGTSFSIDAKSDGNDNTSITADGNGQISIAGDGFEGALKLPKMNINAENFDVNGVRLYPGSSVRDFHLEAKERAGERDKGKLEIAFESPAALPTVQAWFRDNMAKRGFKVETAGNGLKGTTDDGQPFTLDLSADGEAKSKGKLEVGN